ncbi:hypothetical protein [Streptacidiphilus cavernicola]|uniref:Asp23/Gls24 family envelope stress response protein n=1 Tax=Streptacidiphilus cavernicola TaxID=3342716 RepID=A0ABV6VZU7_9ACTN
MALGPQPPPGGAPDHPDRLDCGADLFQLWESGRPQPGHEQCPDCRAERERLHQFDALVRAAAAQPAPDAERLTAKVMDIVRTEIRPGRLVPLGEPVGNDWITEAAAARVLRAAAGRLRGVVCGSCRIRSAAPDADDSLRRALDPLPRGPLRVSVEVAVAASWTVPGVSAALRERLFAVAGTELGIQVTLVDVRVVDLLEETELPEAVEEGGEQT